MSQPTSIPPSTATPYITTVNSWVAVEAYLTDLAVTKSQYSWKKSIVLGMLAGLFITWGGLLSLTTAGGLSSTLRSTHPVLPRMMIGGTFPLALILIILFGGDLFTGNCMIFIMALLHRRVTLRQLFAGWMISWVTNLIGCLVASALFGYATDLYISDPHLTFVRSITETKCSKSFGIILARAIPANALVCMAVCLAAQARDTINKIIAIFIPIFSFCVLSYEHVIANMLYISLGLMYGADTTVGACITHNFIPATIGNILGGLLIGLLLLFLHTDIFSSYNLSYIIASCLSTATNQPTNVELKITSSASHHHKMEERNEISSTNQSTSTLQLLHTHTSSSTPRTTSRPRTRSSHVDVDVTDEGIEHVEY